jgi:hypothetical protein
MAFENKMIILGQIGLGVLLGVWSYFSVFSMHTGFIKRYIMPAFCTIVGFLISYTQSLYLVVLWVIVLLIFFVKYDKVEGD